MAIVVPPTNKAAARPIRADLVMIFSKPTPPKEQRTGIGYSQRFASAMKPGAAPATVEREVEEDWGR